MCVVVVHVLTVDGAEDDVSEHDRPAPVALAAKRVDAEDDETDDGEDEEDTAEDLTDRPPC